MAAVSACFYARLPDLRCQALAAYLMFSDKLNDDDDDEWTYGFTGCGQCFQVSFTA